MASPSEKRPVTFPCSGTVSFTLAAGPFGGGGSGHDAAYALEDDSGALLMEDGTSFILQE